MPKVTFQGRKESGCCFKYIWPQATEADDNGVFFSMNMLSMHNK